MKSRPARQFDILKAILSIPQFFRVRLSLVFFFLHYLKKFRVADVEGKLIIHSHLPPLNSVAYKRFVAEHLLDKKAGPSHAQIGLTNACPQNCEYCYSKNKKGRTMETEAIIALIRDLKSMGVFWFGFTGGEPLLNKNIVKIVESVGVEAAAKLFTTGCTLTKQTAYDLKNAGLYSVSVSLDHWSEEVHDSVRGYPGAFRTALKAIDIFKNLGGVHVSVSAVLSRTMIRNNQVEEFIQFLQGLDINEAWLSEAKPSVESYWNEDSVITEEERLELCRLQDRYNKRGGMTINYLGHFEGKEHFGCSAGNKMVYVDACGNVSPCVFLPVSFGNVRDRPIRQIYSDMKTYSPINDRCFINANYGLLRKNYHNESPIGLDDTKKVFEDAPLTPLARFFRLYNN
ncbi:MAG: radical SAM protein [Bacteroidota bacterium]